MDEKKKAGRIAVTGLLTALALSLGYAENWIVIAPGLPGVKLGLSNTVLLYALYMLDFKSAVLLMLLKILLSSFLYAGFSAMFFSLGGGICSLLIMMFVKKAGKKNISPLSVSVCGAVAHNAGQMMVALFFVQSDAILAYLPVLMIAGVITGALTGIICIYVIRALKHSSVYKSK